MKITPVCKNANRKGGLFMPFYLNYEDSWKSGMEKYYHGI